MSPSSRIAGSIGKHHSFWAMYSLRMSACHRDRDLAQIDPAEQSPHVIDGVDRHALAADLADRQRRVGVVAHQRRHIERGREPRLAVVEQVAEAPVGLLGGAKAGELTHRP
jgi:uncharacterized protein YllA (UPF0747 family)